jgi:hypothetical protein
MNTYFTGAVLTVLIWSHQRRVVRIAKVLRIDDDETVVRDADRGVAADAGHHIQAGFDLFDGRRRGWRSSALTTTWSARSSGT